MTYGAYKDLPRRTTSDEVLRNKAFATASNFGYDRWQCRVALMAYKCFDKKFRDTATHARTKIVSED